jgi:hypothetical protein
MMRLAERGITCGDPLKWGRLQSNECPFATRTPIFVFTLLTEQAPQRSKTKMPRPDRGHPFDWRREREMNLLCNIFRINILGKPGKLKHEMLVGKERMRNRISKKQRILKPSKH